MFVLSNFLMAVAQLLSIVLNAYIWIVIIAVILTWIPLDPTNQLAQTIAHILRRLTEPVFSFVRSKLKLQRYTYPLDFTPMIIILIIYFLQSFLVQTLIELAARLR